MSAKFRLLKGFGSILAIAVVLSAVARPQPAFAAPAPSTSRYMGTVNGSTLYTYGCNAANQGQYGVIVLAYGQPLLQNGQYGTFNYSSNFVTVGQIEAAARSFMQGFWDCGPPAGTLTYVAVGTSLSVLRFRKRRRMSPGK